MTVKVVLVSKRAPGMTREQFRHAYETGHAQFGLQKFGHLWTAYRRNYLVSGHHFNMTPNLPDGVAPPYDVITELEFPDMAALAESNRIINDPATRRVRSEFDKEELFDRPNCWQIVCDVIEEDVATAALAAGNVHIRKP